MSDIMQISFKKMAMTKCILHFLNSFLIYGTLQCTGNRSIPREFDYYQHTEVQFSEFKSIGFKNHSSEDVSLSIVTNNAT